MTSINRRAFGARALGASAAATAAYVGFAPAARAQFGSAGGAAPTVPAPVDPGTPAPTGQPQGTAIASLTSEQLAELDTSVATPAYTGQRVALATTPFRRVAADAGPHVQSVSQLNDRTFFAEVWSPSNQRVMRVGVMCPPASFGPRPTLYCLDGYQDWKPESETGLASAWYWAGGGNEFFMDKNVNVVFTVDPGPTMYRDWVSPMPGRGPIKWETFLTEELPPLIDEACMGNGTNGIMGISSGACAAFMTAVRKPKLYNTVVGMSGVYDVDNLFGKSLWSYMWSQKGVKADWVMGGWFNSQWAANDPYNVVKGNTQSLRGKTVYLSAAAGMPTTADYDNFKTNPDPVLLGGPFEATAFSATNRFASWLGVSGVKVTTDYRLRGVHDWPLWRDQLPKAWPTIAKGLGVDGQVAAPKAETLR